MEKLSGFQITGMTLSGFKSCAETTELAFGSPTVITGGNGAGKSSIADAIAFVVTGLPFFGERGIDRLHCDDNPALFVAMRFFDGSGTHHELTRTRQKSRMTITYDGREIRQLDLTELFGERDVFLSIFNPLYFIEQLGDDGKNLLERYLPSIAHEDVLAVLSDEVRLALENVEMLSPEGLLRRTREEIRTLEESVIYLSGQRDLAAEQQKDGNQRSRMLEQRLADITAELEKMETQRFEGIDKGEYEDRLAHCSARYEEIAKDASANSTLTDLDGRIGALQARLEMRRAEAYIPKYIKPMVEASVRLKDLAERYQKEIAYKDAFTAGMTCPTCHRAVTSESLPEVVAAFDKSISELYALGAAQKGQYQEIKALEQQSMTVFQQYQEQDLQSWESELAQLALQREETAGQHQLSAVRRSTVLDELQQEIRALTTLLEYGNLTQEGYDRLLSCREELKNTQAELTAVQGLDTVSLDDLDARITQAKEDVTKGKKLISHLAMYIGKRAELLFSQLTMNRVAITLYDVVKSTGEVKDTFRFTYNGRLYNRLSLSEKIRAGLEVAELIKRLTGRNYPIFVDNMESVDDLANVRPTGQMIMAKCVRGAALSVQGAGTEAQPKAA